MGMFMPAYDDDGDRDDDDDSNDKSDDDSDDDDEDDNDSDDDSDEDRDDKDDRIYNSESSDNDGLIWFVEKEVVSMLFVWSARRLE